MAANVVDSSKTDKYCSVSIPKLESGSSLPPSLLVTEDIGLSSKACNDFSAVLVNLDSPPKYCKSNVLYDTGSITNIIHPSLVKSLGLKTFSKLSGMSLPQIVGCLIIFIALFSSVVVLWIETLFIEGTTKTDSLSYI